MAAAAQSFAGKLHYWSIKARGYPVAVIASAAGLPLEWPLEEESISNARFAAQQASGVLAFSQWPAVEIEGRWLVQSGAIMRFFARRGGLDGGADESARILCETLLCEAEDMYTQLVRAFYVKDDAGSNKGALDALFSKGSGWFASHAEALERMLTGAGAGAFFSAAPARLAGEYYLACELDCARAVQPDCLDAHPRLRAFADAMLALPAFEGVKDFPPYVVRE